MDDWQQVALAITVLAGVVTALGVLHRKVYKPVVALGVQVSRFIRDWNGWPGDPDRNIDEMPGVMPRLVNIEHELRTNGGSSLRDAVRRVETTVGEIAHRQREMRVREASHADEASRRDRRIEHMADRIDELTRRVDDWQGIDRLRAETATSALHEVLHFDTNPPENNEDEAMGP